VTDIVSEIAAASREQAGGIEQVNKAVTQMDQVTQANASQTEELSSTAESLAAQSAQLQQVVSQFNLRRADTFAAGTRPRASSTPLSVRKPAAAAKKPAAKRPPQPSDSLETAVEQELELVGAARSANGHGRGGFEEF
jgi:methyl-accepting chemotaxis protein